MTERATNRPPGLRERKKQRMREHISAVATRLFVEHGFEDVTVAEVAEAAEVSKMTVFNYFPRKEDLYLDRGPELVALLAAAVRDRRAGEPPLAALRRCALELLDGGHALSGVVDHVHHFAKVVMDSPALAARMRELDDEAAAALAAELASAAGRPEGDPEARFVADAALSVRRLVAAEAVKRSAAGESAARMRPELRALTERLYDALEHGVGPVWAG